MDKDLDLYKILSISKNATQKEISDSFRKLAKKYHPSINGVEYSDMMQIIINAYEILSNPLSREKYDNMVENTETHNLKTKFQEHTSKKKEEIKKIGVDQNFEEYFKKKYGESYVKDLPITKEESKKKYDELIRKRIEDLNKYGPEKILESNISNSKFNTAFEILHQKTNKTSDKILPYESDMLYSLITCSELYSDEPIIFDKKEDEYNTVKMSKEELYKKIEEYERNKLKEEKIVSTKNKK